MSRTQRVGRSLDFVGNANDATSRYNISGNLNLDKATLDADFLKAGDAADVATSVGNGGVVAVEAIANGALRLTASTGADDNCVEANFPFIWYCAQEPSLRMRVKVDAITTVGIAIGWFDNLINTNDQIKCEISGTTVTDRGSTPDLAGFVFDTDQTTDSWYFVNSKAGSQAGTILSGVAPVAATYEVFQIDLDSSGNATYWRNHAYVGRKASAVTAATALGPYAGLIVRASAERNLDIDYVKVWQNRYESSTVLV